MGTQLPLPQRGTAPYFQPISVVDEWLDELRCYLALGMEVGLGPGDFVLDGDPALPPQKGAEPPPQFSAHVYCGQTAGWIKMALGMEVDLGPGHTVLDGTQLPSPKKGAVPPVFGPFLL